MRPISRNHNSSSFLAVTQLYCVALTIATTVGCGKVSPPISLASNTLDALAQTTTSPAKTVQDSVPSGRQINAQGKLLPARGIARLSGLPGDRVESMLVKAGDTLTKDQPIAILKSDSLKRLELDAAELKLTESKSSLETKRQELDLGVSLAKSRVVASKQSIELAKKQVDMAKQAEKQLDQIREQIDSLRRLRNDPLTRAVVGSMELESREIEYDKIESTTRQAKLSAETALKQSEMQLDQAEQSHQAAELARKAIDANSPLAPLEKQIDLIKIQLSESTIRAPYDATVISVLTEMGERITTLPIVEIADLSKMVCVAEVFESDVGRVRIGDSARLKSSALSKELTGLVTRIDRIVGGSQLRSPNPMARTDFRSVGVWIELDEENGALAAERLQLQVDVAISTQK